MSKPAAGVTITLYRIEAGTAQEVSATVTNADGRTDAPMLAGADLQVGVYELVFGAGDYLRATGQALGEVLFLDQIPIRFGITDAAALSGFSEASSFSRWFAQHFQQTPSYWRTQNT